MNQKRPETGGKGKERKKKKIWSNVISLVTRSVPRTRFWVYFGLLEESASQNFKEKKTCTKIRVNAMKGWNMTVKMKIIKDFIKGINKVRSWLKKERREIKKKGENVIWQETRTKPFTRDLGYIWSVRRKCVPKF